MQGRYVMRSVPVAARSRLVASRPNSRLGRPKATKGKPADRHWSRDDLNGVRTLRDKIQPARCPSERGDAEISVREP